MTNILHISVSPHLRDSLSRRIGGELLELLRSEHPDAEIVVRDLAGEPLPHVDGDLATAILTAPDQRTATLTTAIGRSDALVDELIAADIVVLDLPMYNWSIPSALKAWIDHIVRPGRTFIPGPNHTPLLADRPVYIVMSAGGAYERAGRGHHDFLTPYLKHVLGWIGLADLRFIRAEGSAGSLDEALRDARSQLAEAPID